MKHIKGEFPVCNKCGKIIKIEYTALDIPTNPNVPIFENGTFYRRKENGIFYTCNNC